MARPDFWQKKGEAVQKSQELALLKREVETIDNLVKDLEDLREMSGLADPEEKLAAEIKAKADFLDKNVKKLEIELFFSGKYDKGSAVLSVYAGAGGKDAEDWAALLFRMYQRFAEKKGWRTKIIHEHWGEFQGPAGWGIKNATILIEAPYVYGYLKGESGVHRLVRISPFSAKQLRHTSFVLVDVMPEFVAPEEVDVRPEDLKIDFFRSSGPGGQNVNKRETAVRVTHLPTGLQVASQAERTQERNREIAIELLRSKLYRFKLVEQEKERQGIRQAAQQAGRASPTGDGREKIAIEWGSQIRSYVMHPYQMVKDHRTGIETSRIDEVLDGELKEFIEAETKS